MDQVKKNPEETEQKSDNGESQGIGGREFGQVIEPTQGQMASGNKGLTGDVGKEKKEGEAA